MTKRVIIIGGGIIGLSAAYDCAKRGWSVTILDRGRDAAEGCSYGNAGMIVPSHFIPLAAPGMVKLGLKWMLSPESPFYIRPRLSGELMRWLWSFKRACTQANVNDGAPVLRDLHLASREAYVQWQSDFSSAFELAQHGLLMLCRDEHVLQEECDVARRANEIGIEARVLNQQETRDIDANVTMNVCGSVYFPLDCHLSPNQLMACLRDQVSKDGVDLRWNCDVTEFRCSRNKIDAVVTSQGDFEADEVVLASGVWSSGLAKTLDLKIPMQAGKGYSLTLSDPIEIPSICSILTEARVAVTPMGSTLRFGGTMEIAGNDTSVSPRRIRGLVRSIPQYYPRFTEKMFEGIEPWAGLRPCSPDGLPYLGRPARWQNLVVCTGHAMMGISLAPVSGKLVGKLLDGEPPGIANIDRISPDRFDHR